MLIEEFSEGNLNCPPATFPVNLWTYAPAHRLLAYDLFLCWAFNMSMSSSMQYLACSKEGDDVIYAFLGMTVRFMVEAVVLLCYSFPFESSFFARIVFAS